MAAPTYVTASTGSTDPSGSWTHTAAAPTAAGNVLIVQLEQDGDSTGSAGPSITSVTNAESLDGTDNTLTYVGAFAMGSTVTPVAYQHIWIGRALNTSAMVITGANGIGANDLYVRVYEFTNVSAGTTLATVIENSTAGATTNGAGATAAISDTAVVTLGPDRLALNFVAVDDDNVLGSFTGESGGNWAEAVAYYADSGGSDACIQLQTAAMTSAGTVDGGSYTMSVADNWGVIGFALIGTTVDTPVPRHGFVHHNNPGTL